MNTIITNIKIIPNIIKKNKKYGIILFIIGIIVITICLFQLSFNKSKTENFQSNKSNQSNQSNQLTNESIQQFLQIQHTMNPHTNFDTSKLQEQVTQEELNSFVENGMWPWSQEVIDLYSESTRQNKIIRTDPLESLQYARTIYNQTAILNLLSYQTKEGDFLINGIVIHNNLPNPLEDLPSGFGSFGYKSGLIKSKNDMIKCNIDALGNNSHLEKIHYTGKGGIFGEQTKKTTPVDYTNLEKEIPGFKFINGPCNPCSIFNNPSDYSCKFELNNLRNEPQGISSIWKYIWSSY
jgi:hypothetical protein